MTQNGKARFCTGISKIDCQQNFASAGKRAICDDCGVLEIGVAMAVATGFEESCRRGKWCALQGLNLRTLPANYPLPSQIASQNSDLPADLQRVADAWPRLSKTLKDAILAIVAAVAK